MKRSLTVTFQTLHLTIVNSHPQSVAARISKLRTKNRPTFIIIRLLNTLQAQGEHENGGKVLRVTSNVLDGQTLTLQCSQRDANINTVVTKKDDDGDSVIKLQELKVHIILLAHLKMVAYIS